MTQNEVVSGVLDDVETVEEVVEAAEGMIDVVLVEVFHEHKDPQCATSYRYIIK